MCSYHDVRLPPAELVAAIERATSGEAEPELAAAIAEDCARTIDWLAAQGAQFASASPIRWHRWTLAPPRAAVAGQDWQGRGPDLMIARLRGAAGTAPGPHVARHPRHRRCGCESGRCVGLAASRDGAAI